MTVLYFKTQCKDTLVLSGLTQLVTCMALDLRAMLAHTAFLDKLCGFTCFPRCAVLVAMLCL